MVLSLSTTDDDDESQLTNAALFASLRRHNKPPNLAIVVVCVQRLPAVQPVVDDKGCVARCTKHFFMSVTPICDVRACGCEDMTTKKISCHNCRSHVRVCVCPHTVNMRASESASTKICVVGSGGLLIVAVFGAHLNLNQAAR